MDLAKIGQKILEYRLRHSMTQKDFADLLNVWPLAVNNWERGKSYPNRINQARIKRILEEEGDEEGNKS